MILSDLKKIFFFKKKNIIDNIFLVFEIIECIIESDQPMVMLLLDFKKTYKSHGIWVPLD